MLLVAVLSTALVVVGVLLVRTRRELDVSRRMLAQLEADLDAALRPSPALSPTERALRAVGST